MEKITKEEFEESYAIKSNMTVQQLYELWLKAYPCDCDYGWCRGWSMDTEENRKFLASLNIKNDTIGN